MLSFGPATKISLCVQACDMRKSFFTLASLVTNELKADPLSGHVFGFCNRAHNLAKLLVWDGTGYWVMAKRLAKGTFAWPTGTTQVHVMTSEELTMLLGGLDLKRVKQRAWHRLPANALISS